MINSLETHKNLTKEKVEVHQEQNIKQETKFIGSVVVRSGRKLWMYDKSNDSMQEVKIVKKGAIDLTGSVIENKKAQYNPNHLYFWAINEKNARKKLNQYRNGNYNVVETFDGKEYDKLPQIF